MSDITTKILILLILVGQTWIGYELHINNNNQQRLITAARSPYVSGEVTVTNKTDSTSLLNTKYTPLKVEITNASEIAEKTARQLRGY